MSKLLAVVIATLLALGLAACGGDDESKGTNTAVETESPVETVTVRENEFELRPESPRVARTGLVEFRIRNEGKIVHALEVEGPSREAKTGEIQPGGSASLRVDLSEAGSYDWYCPIGNHRGLGMEGKIRVGRPAQTGTTKTQTQTTETQTGETPTTETPTTETAPTAPPPADGTGDSGGSGGSGSGGSGSGGSGTGGSGY